MMNVFKAVESMLAVRSYRPDPIPTDITTRILEAGRLTGSSQNRQEWDFIVIRMPETLRELGEEATTGSYIADAPMAIAIVVPDSPVGYIDGARAAQDMMLVAWEQGIGSNWVSNVNTRAIKDLLNVPHDRRILTIIPFGYPGDDIDDVDIDDVQKDRRPLEEIAHEGGYEQPYNP